MSYQGLIFRYLVTFFIASGHVGAVKGNCVEVHDLAMDPLTKHVVMIRGDGTPLNPITKEALSASSARAYMDRIIDQIKDFKPDTANKIKVMIIAHGGRKTFKSILKRSRDTYQEILDSGYYPIFLIWDSNLRDNLMERFFKVRGGREVHGLGSLATAPFLILSKVIGAIAKAPVSIIRQLENDIEASNITFAGEKQVESQYQNLRNTFERNPDSPSTIKISRREDSRTFWNSFGRCILYFRSLPFTIITTPFISEFGKEAWQNMKRRTKALFRKNNEFIACEKKTSELYCYNRTGALGIFLHEFSNMLEANRDQKDDREIEITLLGHSMGAIILNEMIRSYNDLPYRNIIYMAAACPISDLETSVIPHLSKNKSAKFYNICLHPQAEKAEINYGDLTPRGSLLVWIDNFFTEPETEFDRTLGRWENLLRVIHVFPDSIKGQLNIKAYGVRDGKDFRPRVQRGDAVNDVGPGAHSDFSHYENWRATFWEPDIEPMILKPVKPVYSSYGEIALKQTRLRGQWATMASLRGGLIKDHTFGIGLSYHELISNVAGVRESNLTMMYGGIDLDFLDESINTQTFFGLGFIGSRNSGDRFRYGADWFFVIEPSQHISRQITKWGQVNVGVAYRFVVGVNYHNLSNNDLNGLSVNLSIKFGSF